MDCKWILLSFDGTSSEDLKALGDSHVRRLHREFGHGFSKRQYDKDFFEGPPLIDTKSRGILESAKMSLQRMIFGLMGPVAPEVMKSHDHLRVVIISHSRGSGIAIDLARKLRDEGIKIYFLGMFDAVDRSTQIDGGQVENVRYVYHAYRSDAIGGRWYMGNTGTKVLGSEGWKEETFWTSHGGTNGQVESHPLIPMVDDFSCGVAPIVIWKKVGLVTEPESIESFEMAKDRNLVCKQESIRAYEWIKQHAKKHQLLF